MPSLRSLFQRSLVFYPLALALVSCQDGPEDCRLAFEATPQDEALAGSLVGQNFTLRSYKIHGESEESRPQWESRLLLRANGTLRAWTGLNLVTADDVHVDPTLGPGRYIIAGQKLEVCGAVAQTHAGTKDPVLQAQHTLVTELLTGSPSVQASPGLLTFTLDGVGALTFQAPPS